MTTSSKEDSQDDGEQNQIISDDEGLQEHHKDDQHKRDTTTAQVSNDEYIPHGIVEVVNAMIKDLNDTYYSTIPDVSNRKAGDLYQAYHSVLRSKLMWSTKTVESHLLSVQAVLSKRQHCLSSWYYVCGQASTESNGVARSVRT